MTGSAVGHVDCLILLRPLRRGEPERRGTAVTGNDPRERERRGERRQIGVRDEVSNRNFRGAAEPGGLEAVGIACDGGVCALVHHRQRDVAVGERPGPPEAGPKMLKVGQKPRKCANQHEASISSPPQKKRGKSAA